MTVWSYTKIGQSVKVMNATMTNMTICLNTTKTNVLNLLAHKGAPTVKKCNIIKTSEQIFPKI